MREINIAHSLAVFYILGRFFVFTGGASRMIHTVKLRGENISILFGVGSSLFKFDHMRLSADTKLFMEGTAF